MGLTKEGRRNPLGDTCPSPIPWGMSSDGGDDYLDWMIIDVLMDFDKAPVIDIAEHIGTDGRRATGRLKALANRDLVEKTDPGDPEHGIYERDYLPYRKCQWWRYKGDD